MNTIKEIKSELEKEVGARINPNTLYIWIRKIESEQDIQPTYKLTQKNDYLYKYYEDENAQKIKDTIIKEHFAPNAEQIELKEIEKEKLYTTTDMKEMLKEKGITYDNCASRIKLVEDSLKIKPQIKMVYGVKRKVYTQQQMEKIIDRIKKGYRANKHKPDSKKTDPQEINEHTEEDYSKAITILDDIINENKKLKENNETLLHELRIIKTKNKELAEEVEELKKQKDTGLIQRLLKLRG